MAAYAMTSLLLGVVFAALGMLRCGSLVRYFPETVMTGVIGGVGVSLFQLGLEMTFPRSSHITLRDLFARAHLPLLAASLLPAVVLSVSSHLGQKLLGRAKKITRHALYIPSFCIAVAIVFWVVVVIAGATDIQRLASAGWLFSVDTQREPPIASQAWNYWSLFDFSRIEWRAMVSVLSHVVLLVVVGALSLPVLTPLIAAEVKQQLLRENGGMPVAHSLDINREFFAHALSNVASAASGALPNMVVFSNTRFFARASGHRPDALMVLLITFAFLFLSSRVLPYVPTIMASTLVLFIGIELVLDALWASTKHLLWYEWIVVLGTTIGCSVLGFVPGIGVGLIIVMMVLPCWHQMVDSRPRSNWRCAPTNYVGNRDGSSGLPPLLPRVSLSAEFSKDVEGFPCADLKFSPTPLETGYYPRMQPPIIHLAGHPGFTAGPLLDNCFNTLHKGIMRCAIIDMSSVCRLDTDVALSIAKLASGMAAQSPPGLLLVVQPSLSEHNRQVQADIQRGGLDLRQLDGGLIHGLSSVPSTASAPTARVCKDLIEAVLLCRRQSPEAILRPLSSLQEGQPPAKILAFADELLEQLLRMRPISDVSSKPTSGSYEALTSAGLVIREVEHSEVISSTQYPVQHEFMVLQGQVVVDMPFQGHKHAAPSQPIRAAVTAKTKALLGTLADQMTRNSPPKKRTPEATEMEETLESFDWFHKELAASKRAHASRGPCWILDVDSNDTVGMLAANRAAQRWATQECVGWKS
ncbi:hypothetical protein E8E12_000454 [Didymella heteroderae]|uniref:SLC26A/SulP transporter domain-containing protein n=1 Tax=Didymella heteroderae TaxID=1769908 RepID=A0A9P4WFQ7_9PLEO|nr:hypothetical protein E8E12_000454 [Didymella heteroderae]